MLRNKFNAALLAILLINGGIVALAFWIGPADSTAIETIFPIPEEGERAPAVLISKDDQRPTTFELLMEALEICRKVCGAEDQTGATVDPKTLERTCICPDGTLVQLPPILR